MHESLQKAVTKVLSPLVRLLLRHGVSHAEFTNWAKQAYISEAHSRFGIEDKPPSISRISIVTGINRKEVKRILELPSQVSTSLNKQNRAVRVITGWLQDPDFQDENGKPRELHYGDTHDSFCLLVKRYGGDVPARAMLDELERVGTVEYRNGTISMRHQGYVPLRSETALLEIFANSASDLLTTLDHNLRGLDPRRFQMSVTYDNVTTTGREQFQALSTEQAMKLLKTLDQTLSEHDRDANPAATGEGKHRIGLGLYWIEDTSTTIFDPSQE